MSVETRTSLKGVKTAAEAMEAAGLCWPVEDREMLTSTGKEISTHKAIVRGDTGDVLGVVGKGYKAIQNSTAFSFFDAARQSFGAEYTSAESLFGGKRIVLTAKLPGVMEPKLGDIVERTIQLMNSHDGTSSLFCSFMGKRLVCMNGMTRSVKEAYVYLRHTSKVESRAKEAFRALNISAQFFAEFEIQCKYLTQKIVDKQMVSRFLDEVIGSPYTTDESTKEVVESVRIQNKRDNVVEKFEHGLGNSGKTAWDLYNGLTEYVDHGTNLTNEDKRTNSALFGSGADIKSKAFDVALAL